MKCPFCGKSNDKVIDSRLIKNGNTVRRRRECFYCANRFTTYENIEKILLIVSKKNGRKEPFSIEKIKIGIHRALEKLDIGKSSKDNVISELEVEIRGTGEREISSKEIGERVMCKLHKLNDIAYVRFASVYREFKHVGDFVSELENLLKQK